MTEEEPTEIPFLTEEAEEINLAKELRYLHQVMVFWAHQTEGVSEDVSQLILRLNSFERLIKIGGIILVFALSLLVILLALLFHQLMIA